VQLHVSVFVTTHLLVTWQYATAFLQPYLVLWFSIEGFMFHCFCVVCLNLWRTGKQFASNFVCMHHWSCSELCDVGHRWAICKSELYSKMLSTWRRSKAAHGNMLQYIGQSKIFRTDAVKIINLTTKRVWKLPTSTQLRATWHTDSLHMVVLPCTGASRYHNCCIDDGTSPEYFGWW
jgi:hypothetical protein